VGCSDDKNTIDPSDDTIAEFSSRGPSHYTKYKPDVVAPGVDIISLANSSTGYVSMSGTSMSTPVVSGCCALMLEKDPQLKPDDLKQRLTKNAYSLHQTRFAQGSGSVNVSALIK
jgi:serine protease AprX